MDLGSANLRLVDARGRRLEEAAVLARERQGARRIVAYGNEARRMEGRAPSELELVHPIRRGAIADYDAAEALLGRLLARLGGRGRFRRPRPVLVAARWGQSQVEERAIEQALESAGAGRVHFLAAPLLAAAGLGLEVAEPRGRLIVDVGAGESSAAVVTAGGIALAGRWPVGGEEMDEAIIRWFRQEHGLVIGRPTAERLRTTAAAAPGAAPGEERVSVAGVHVGSGLPAVVTVPAGELAAPLVPVLDRIAESVAQLLGETPPELLADIWEDGGHQVGRGALLRGLPEYLGRKLELRLQVAENAAEAVADGLVAVLRGTLAAPTPGSLAYRTA
ncbi:MAG: rod shape-determining protein [Bacillota bacterium]|nr:rod shape-determining protein [Bacillota bacterium]